MRKPAHPIVQQWIEREFRQALHDPAITNFAISLLKAGTTAGDDPAQIMRGVLAGVVLHVAGINPKGPLDN